MTKKIPLATYNSLKAGRDNLSNSIDNLEAAQNAFAIPLPVLSDIIKKEKDELVTLNTVLDGFEPDTV